MLRKTKKRDGKAICAGEAHHTNLPKRKLFKVLGCGGLVSVVTRHKVSVDEVESCKLKARKHKEIAVQGGGEETTKRSSFFKSKRGKSKQREDNTSKNLAGERKGEKE